MFTYISIEEFADGVVKNNKLNLNISAICITIWILPSMCSSPIPTVNPIESSLLGALKCRPAMTV